MNSLDDSLDEQLRRQFQQVFDAYEVTPPASLKDRIWRQLPKNTFRQYVSYCLVLVGVLLPINGYLLEQPLAEGRADKPSAGDPLSQISTRRAAKPVETLTVGHMPESASVSAKRSARPTVQVALPRNTLRLDAPVYRPDVWSASPLKEVIELVKVNGVRTRASVDARETESIKRLNNYPATVAQDRTISVRDSTATNELDMPLLSVGEEMQHQPKAPGVDETDWLLIAANRLTSRWVPGAGLPSRLTRQVALVPVSKLPEKQAVRRNISWFVRAAALNTYQQMTVIAKTGVHVQGVRAPTVWSGQTWGYQLSGGIAWRQWDAYVSYGQLRRWAYYQLATDDYEVKPTGPAGYQVSRRIETRSENVALPLLGVGISRQYILGKHQRYYARLGGQFTYVPPTQQALGWAQAGWGLNLPLGKAHRLQVGPTIEYSLNRIWSTERQLIIQPYTVGVSVALRPQIILTR